MTNFACGARVVGIAAMFALLSACSGTTEAQCDTALAFGVSVTITDASTSAAPTSSLALQMSDSTYVENFFAPGGLATPPVFNGALERPGNYVVVINAPGYGEYTSSTLSAVRKGRCGVLQTVKVNAKLLRVQ